MGARLSAWRLRPDQSRTTTKQITIGMCSASRGSCAGRFAFPGPERREITCFFPDARSGSAPKGLPVLAGIGLVTDLAALPAWLMPGAILLRREQGRGLPRFGTRAPAANRRSLRLVGAGPGGGDVGPCVPIGPCRADRGRGGQREGGMDLCGGQRQCPLLA